MDFGATLSRALRITWQHKVLWVLGFLAALGSGSGSSVSPNTFQYTFSGDELPPGMQDLLINPGVILAGLAGLGCILLLLSIVLFVVGIIARGGLIAGVQHIETEGSTTFGRAWSAGASRFWRLLGLNILLILPIIIIVIIGILAFGGTVLGFVGIGVAGGRGDQDQAAAAAMAGVTLALCLGGVLLCAGLIYGLIAMALQTFGERAIVLENVGVMDSIRRAWAVFRQNLGNIIVLALVMAVLSAVLGLIIGAISVALFLPTVLVAMNQAREGLQAGTVILGTLSFILLLIVSAIIGALFVAFNSSTWTLAYRQFIGAAPTAISAVPPSAPLTPVA